MDLFSSKMDGVLFTSMHITLGGILCYAGIMLCKRKSFVVKDKVIIFIFFIPMSFALLYLFNSPDSIKLHYILVYLIIFIYFLISNKFKYRFQLFNITENELYENILLVFKKLKIEFNFKKEKRCSKYTFRDFDSMMTIRIPNSFFSGNLIFSKPKNIPDIDNLLNELQRSLNGKPFPSVPMYGMIFTVFGFLITIMGFLLLIDQWIDIF